MVKTQITAIVLAAGSGSRMRSDIPKQYMQINGKPLLYYSIKAFEDSEADNIILVASADSVEYCRKSIVEEYAFDKVRAVVSGGAERYLSVYNGLCNCTGTDYVLIHDGARPMIDVSSINRSIACVKAEGACVLATRVKDTIKRADADNYVEDTPERSSLWTVQTPQCFSYGLLMEAYDRLFAAQKAGETLPPITDDAMIVEQMMSQKVKLLEGNYENIKVTTPEDLLIAEAFLTKK
jgi:2-C-methyl-D-erythritol 4-phosphate cytidylyltransferase